MRQTTAKLFKTGGSQAVRLPAEFRFSGTEVLIRKDERTGEVILTARPRPTRLTKPNANAVRPWPNSWK